jgi:hypothetical protein
VSGKTFLVDIFLQDTIRILLDNLKAVKVQTNWNDFSTTYIYLLENKREIAGRKSMFSSRVSNDAEHLLKRKG